MIFGQDLFDALSTFLKRTYAWWNSLFFLRYVMLHIFLIDTIINLDLKILNWINFSFRVHNQYFSSKDPR